MTSDGGLLSDKAVKPRRSANSSAARVLAGPLRRGGEARSLTEAAGFLGGEWTRPDPGQHRPVRPRRDSVLMHPPAGKAGEPAPAGLAWRAWRGRSGEPSGHEPQRLDHLAAIRAPEPGAPGDQRMGRSEGQRSTGQRHAVRDQACAEIGQKPFGRRRFGRRVNQPGEG